MEERRKDPYETSQFSLPVSQDLKGRLFVMFEGERLADR